MVYKRKDEIAEEANEEEVKEEKKKGGKAADADGDDDGDDDKHSSGQGCTMVVVSKKCNKHGRGAVCNFNLNHEPFEFTVTREHITRSNVGKWFNVFISNLSPRM